MKYVIVLTDGVADVKIKELGNKTPLQVAKIPTINKLAQMGEIGTVKTVPDGMTPGSDAANLSVMGYDPQIYHTGRSPLEAISMGIDLEQTDVTFRCNLVTLSAEGSYFNKTMLDNSAGEISSQEAAILIAAVNEALKTEDIAFYAGVSYRHAMVWNHGIEDFEMTPPHDILDKQIKDYLPRGKDADFIIDMMEKSYAILKDHPVNKKREEQGLRPANSIWIWGQGRKPRLDSFYEKYGMRGSVVSAVDLIKGIGICAGLESIDVEGVTANIHTNFSGKTMAVIEELAAGKDFVYLHVEAPDECGHQGDVKGKVKSMEIIDEIMVKPIFEYLKTTGEDFKILILPDHPTPICIRTHTGDPVPYVLFDSRNQSFVETNAFDEELATASGNYFDKGFKLTDYFLDKK